MPLARGGSNPTAQHASCKIGKIYLFPFFHAGYLLSYKIPALDGNERSTSSEGKECSFAFVSALDFSTFDVILQ